MPPTPAPVAQIQNILSSVDPMVGIIGVILSTVGIVFGIIGVILTLRAWQSREPSWAITTSTWIRDYREKLSGLEVMYNNEVVGNLSVSKLVFWNDGKLPIRHDDVPERDPIMLVADDGVELLECVLLVVNKPANNITLFISSDRKDALLQFDYLEKGDGAVFQIVHTGVSSRSLYVRGDVIGPKKWHNRVNIADKQDLMARRISKRIGIATYVTIALLVISLITSWISKPAELSKADEIVVGVLIGIAFVPIVIWVMDRFTRVPPKGLEIYREQ